MIKTLIITGLISLVLSSQKECNSNNKKAGCYKGRLEIKGICSNYTITVLEGDLDSSKIAKSWTDEK